MEMVNYQTKWMNIMAKKKHLDDQYVTKQYIRSDQFGDILVHDDIHKEYSFMDDILFSDGPDNTLIVKQDCGKPTGILIDEEKHKDLVIEGMGYHDISAEKTPTGYKIKKTITQWKPKSVVVESDFVEGPTKSFTDFLLWAHDLTDEELTAAIQVYYDKWNFEKGDTLSHARYLLLTEEMESRK